MNEEYDAIVLGTGLKECIISGLLSVDKKKAGTSNSAAAVHFAAASQLFAVPNDLRLTCATSRCCMWTATTTTGASPRR